MLLLKLPMLWWWLRMCWCSGLVCRLKIRYKFGPESICVSGKKKEGKHKYGKMQWDFCDGCVGWFIDRHGVWVLEGEWLKLSFRFRSWKRMICLQDRDDRVRGGRCVSNSLLHWLCVAMGLFLYEREAKRGKQPNRENSANRSSGNTNLITQVPVWWCSIFRLRKIPPNSALCST